MSEEFIPTLVITGPPGVGKTTVGGAIGELLEERGEPHALIDLDWMRWCWPRPADDPFHTALGVRNLAAVWANYRAAGARRLILVDVVENRATLDDYRAAVPGAAIILVRLHADLSTIYTRLAGREAGESLAWHQSRAAVLNTQMERDALEDLRIDTAGRDPAAIAREILEQTTGS
jgi:DNA polymerase III delta prime subunit